MKAFIFRLLSLLFFTSFCTVLVWHYYAHSVTEIVDDKINSDVPHSGPSVVLSDKKPHANKNVVVGRRVIKKHRVINKGAAAKVIEKPPNSNDAAASNQGKVKRKIANKEDDIFDVMLGNYSSKWTKQENNIKSFRSSLGKRCNAITNATVTQGNSPVGTTFTFDGDKKIMTVTKELFSVFPKESPFKKAPWDTCAVVGNGGILANSGCGKQIDSATYVIRCNLPPLNNGHGKDTGSKTNLVTANPSILYEKYRALNEHRRSFLDDMQLYKDALLFLPAFSYRRNTVVSMRAFYTLDDFGRHGPKPVFFNPAYLTSLKVFWRDQGIRSLRLSTGIMMASLALELCNNVHLYGFWPFGTHPYTHQKLTNHYYDNRPVNKRMHAMPAEFTALLNLHNKGVIHLHLGECTNQTMWSAHQ